MWINPHKLFNYYYEKKKDYFKSYYFTDSLGSTNSQLKIHWSSYAQRLCTFLQQKMNYIFSHRKYRNN